MNLVQTRAKFRDLSGRRDLVNDDNSDNGADFFINEGCRYLDRLDETNKSWASCFRFVQIGGFSVQVPYCRAIKEVWAMTSSERWQLTKMNLQELIADYMSDEPSQRDTGEPLMYSPTITRYIPEDETADSFEAYVGFVDIPAGNAHEYNSILLSCPASSKLAVEVKGLFYSHYLEDDTDENFWTAVHPHLAILSTKLQIAMSNGDTRNINDLVTMISSQSRLLGMDLVEEIIAEADQMEG